MTTISHPTKPTLSISDSLLYLTALSESKARGTLTQTITGHACYQVSKLVTGEKIALEGGSDYGVITHAQLVALQAMADDPKPMTINYSGQFNVEVMFDYTAGKPIEAEKIQFKYINSATDFYNNVKLKFIKV